MMSRVVLTAAAVLGISTGGTQAVSTPNTGAALPIGTGFILMLAGLGLLLRRQRTVRPSVTTLPAD